MIEFKRNGETVKVEVHADNLSGQWTIRVHSSGYGGRCWSFRDIGLGIYRADTPRNVAEQIMRDRLCEF